MATKETKWAELLRQAVNEPGVEYSRGYIQSWLGERNEIPEKSAQKIFSCADKILKAGKVSAN